MASRAHVRSTEGAPATAGSPLARRAADPLLDLQRTIGNRATGQLVARKAVEQATVKIGKLTIKITGGNASDWAARKDPDTLEVTSQVGKHSAELERMSKSRTKVPLMKVTAPQTDQSGKNLDYGWVELEFTNARISGYAVDGKVETWRAVDFEKVHRTIISHRSGI